MIDILKIGEKYFLKEISVILKLPYKDSTNSRNALLKEISRYYKLQKVGRKYEVLKKYDKPLQKIDGRKNNGGHIANTKYGKLMDNLLINWLYEIDLDGIAISFNQLFGQDTDNINIPFLTKKYQDLLKVGYKNFAKEIGIKSILVDAYTEKLRKIIDKCLETALNRLQKNNIITWAKEYMIKHYDLSLETASTDIVEEIKEKEKEVYTSLGITPYDRKNPIINKKFKKKVCSLLTKYHIANYWKVYDIKIIDYDSIVKIDNADEIKKDLTARFIKSIHTSLFDKKFTTDEGKQYYPFNNFDSIEQILELDNYFFLDIEQKSIWNLLDEIPNLEELEELENEKIWS